MTGKTRVAVKTKKLRGKAVVRGGAGTATSTVGLLGGILTDAVEAGIIETNPAHGIRKPKDNVRKRRLSEAEYRILGRILRSEGDRGGAPFGSLDAAPGASCSLSSKTNSPKADEAVGVIPSVAC